MILATDLDRTLLPNGKDKNDNSLPVLIDLIKKNKITLVYVSGRDLKLLNEAIKEYDIPLPNFFVSDVGATLYKKESGTLVVDNDWRDNILRENPDWQRNKIEIMIRDEDKIFLQEKEKQSEFKISFYVKESNYFDKKAVLEYTKGKLTASDIKVNLIYSFDPLIGLGLLDILPSSVSKISALEFLLKKLEVDNSEIIYVGDSGNDILPLSSDWKAIIVKNAPEKIKASVLAHRTINNSLENLYIAKGTGELNGNYASGIIEGLKHFGILK